MADNVSTTTTTAPATVGVFSDKKKATSAEARKVFGKSIEDITKAVDAARNTRPSGTGPVATAPAEVAAGEEPAVEEVSTSAGTPVAVETPAEATPTPDQALRAREARLVENQTKLGRERKEFENYKMRAESELAQAREIVRLSQSDPFAYFEKYHGIKPDAFATALGQQAQARGNGQQGTPTVGQQALPPDVARELQEGRQFRQQFAEQEKQRAVQSEQENFARQASAGGARWPLASKFSPEKLKQKGWQMVQELVNRGVVLTNEEVLDRIEDELSEIASLGKPAGSSKSVAGNTAAGSANGQAARAPAQTTLSARADSEGNPPIKPFANPYAKDRIAAGVRAVEEALKKKG